MRGRVPQQPPVILAPLCNISFIESEGVRRERIAFLAVDKRRSPALGIADILLPLSSRYALLRSIALGASRTIGAYSVNIR